MYIQTTGLILRETEYKETSRILTVLTEKEGKLTVSARGAKRRGSMVAASTQFLSYSELILFFNKDRYTLTEARSVELFPGLRESLEGLSLGAYVAELLDSVSDEDAPNPELLPLGLNALYAISAGKRQLDVVKGAFEMRLMCLSGFGPRLDCCAVCGRTDPERPILSLSGGLLCCTSCAEEVHGSERLTPSVLEALRYVTSAPAKRLYSFALADRERALFSRVCESYLLTQLGHGFRTLDYYKSIK